MRRRVLPAAAVAVALGVWFGSASAAWAEDTITPMCTTEQAGQQACKETGWYTSPVMLSWAWNPVNGTKQPGSCTEESYNTDVTETDSCAVSWGQVSKTTSYTIQIEVSDPTATASLARPPDSNGWYNHPVGVSVQGSAFSGIASCTPATTYYGPDMMGATVSGSCTDNAGKKAAASVGFHYDATPPTVTGAMPSRPPDFNGWYNHPVSFAFAGTDALSGIDSCSTVTYVGPDNANAQVVGSCRDRAGNVASLAIPFRYQATPPSLEVADDPGDGIVQLRWQASADLEIVRSPGVNGAATTVVYKGNSGSFDDTRVRDGVHYKYTFTAQDQAGNVTVRTLFATPLGPRLLAPPPHATLTAPPLLQWTPVRGATYYNVQLFRRGHKVLSIWPGAAQLQLKRAWRFAGRHYRLTPGRYRWYVWPGFGRRAAGRYGPKVGMGTFVIERRPELGRARKSDQSARRVGAPLLGSMPSAAWLGAFG